LTGAGSNNVSIQLQMGSSEEEGQIHQLPSIAWLTFLLALSHELPVAAGADMDNCPFFLLYLKKVNQDKGNPFFFFFSRIQTKEILATSSSTTLV
jgi:hypothetical protein